MTSPVDFLPTSNLRDDLDDFDTTSLDFSQPEVYFGDLQLYLENDDSISDLFNENDDNVSCEKQIDSSTIDNENNKIEDFDLIDFNDWINNQFFQLLANDFVEIHEDPIQNIINELKEGFIPVKESPTAQSVIDAIYDTQIPMLIWVCQPPETHRFRYETDGIRYLEASRQNPPTIELPDLSQIELGPDQSFGVQLTLVTTDENPGAKNYLHEYKLLYNEDGVIQNGEASVRILLTEKEIREKRKKFRKLQIIRKKHGQFSYQLIPYDPFFPDLPAEKYFHPTGPRMTSSKKAKHFSMLYHTDQAKIICQFMFRDGRQWHSTEIFCETHVIHSGKSITEE